jgi:hypothetical protein
MRLHVSAAFQVLLLVSLYAGAFDLTRPALWTTVCVLKADVHMLETILLIRGRYLGRETRRVLAAS